MAMHYKLGSQYLLVLHKRDKFQFFQCVAIGLAAQQLVFDAGDGAFIALVLRHDGLVSQAVMLSSFFRPSVPICAPSIDAEFCKYTPHMLTA